MISIIIPAYNAEKTIIESLDSIKRQTYFDYEVVIIDDGSKDNTAKIIKEYAINDERIKCFYQENKGVAIARNKGLAKSKGEYICFLDADDFYESTYLEKMYKRIIHNKSHVCYCGYNIIINNSKIIKKTKFKNGDILLDKIYGKININTTGWLISKDLIVKNGFKFPEGVSWGEDFEFFSEIVANTNRISYVPEYLTNYKAGHCDKQLSSFSLDKVDQDYESIIRIINNPKINKNKEIEKALLDYRLQALIIYRLVLAINKGADFNEIKKYYYKYEDYIKKWTFDNGLRSIKLNLSRFKLIKSMMFD